MKDIILGFLAFYSIAIGLTTLFVILKLTELIEWGWWGVTSPIWVQTLIAVGIIIHALRTAYKNNRRR